MQATAVNTSDTLTEKIRVLTHSVYVPDRSEPENDVYFFAYRIRIVNEGDEAAQLLERRWVITDGIGKQEFVQGPGVVGKTPRIAPGGSFEYTSFCPLATSHGTLEGSYTMVRDDGSSFDVTIGAFRLIVPYLLN